MNERTKIGDTVAHYRVLEKLGAGGMGVVYRAEDSRLGRPVALKFLAPELTRDDNARRRFLHEAHAASVIDHPHVCTLHDIEETADGQIFLVMSYYPGETLKTRLRHGPLDVEDAVDLATQIGEGLAAAHAGGVVHRDIKRANVMITKSGIAKILDFGLAKLQDVTGVTRSGEQLGTLAYMAPEHVGGDAVDHRVDVWALGAVLYEMLAGRPPFRSESAAATFYAILSLAPEPLHRVRPIVPPELGGIVGRALAKRPDGRYQSAEEMLVALRTCQGRADGWSTSRRLGAERRLHSIAVLPFSDMSVDRNQGYFCEGIAEELINALTAVAGLNVVSRTSAFQFQEQRLDISEIGRRLNADVVLEGGVRQVGDQVRITVQLVTVADGYQLWAERYDRELDDVFAIQDEIARAVVDRLKVELLSEPGEPLVKRHTDDLEAYTLYLQGRYYWSRRYEGHLAKALECFAQAVARDESYGLAHTGLADAYSILAIYGAEVPREAFTKAKAAAQRAVVLDPMLAEAHQAMAFVHSFFDWDWAGAEAEYRRALNLNPAAGFTHAQFGVFLASQARFPEATAAAATGVKLDPVSPLVGFYAAATLINARHYPEALADCDRVLDLDPNFALALWVKALVCAYLHREAEAIEAAERAVALSQRQTFFLAGYGVTCALAGRLAEAEQALAELTARSKDAYVMPLHLADIYAALGDRDRSFEWLERASDERNGFVIYLATMPIYDSLRTDPRYSLALAKLGLTDPGAVSPKSGSGSPS